MTQAFSTMGLQNFTQLADQRWESRRKRITHLIFAIYWLLIFEGVLRKWVAPHFARELFFIRDPLVAWVYYLALSERMQLQRSIFLIMGLVFGVICVPLVFLQFASSPYVHSWVLSVYGWRNYFFYFPLAFVIAKHFKAKEFEVLMRWTLILAIPIAVVVYFQFQSPATAPINQGIGTGEEVYRNAGVALNRVRTYGTFTSSPGQGAFISSVLAMLLAVWLRPNNKRPLQGLALLAATAAVLSCLALSGSRGAMVAAGIIFAAAVAAALLVAGRTLAFQKLFIPLLLLTGGIFLAPVVFPQAVEAFRLRWVGAGYDEQTAYGGGGILGRAIYELGSFRFLLASTPPQGYQLGIGGNAGGISGASSQNNTTVDPRLISFGSTERGAAESDWGRQVIELGPVLGLLFIVFRVAFVIWLGQEAVAATVRSSDPLPLILFAFIGVDLFSGQITGHGTVNGYAWLFAGFCMSINRRGADSNQSRKERISRWNLSPGSAGLGHCEPTALYH